MDQNHENTNQPSRGALQSLYPTPTSGILADDDVRRAAQEPSDEYIDLSPNINRLEAYIRIRLKNRITVGVIMIGFFLFLPLLIIREITFLQSFGSVEIAWIVGIGLLWLGLLLLQIVLLVINIKHSRHIQLSYLKVNSLVYVRGQRLLGGLSALVGMFEFLKLFSPAHWLIEPDKQGEHLFNASVFGLSSYVEFDQANKAEQLQLVLERYFKLRNIT